MDIDDVAADDADGNVHRSDNMARHHQGQSLGTVNTQDMDEFTPTPVMLQAIRQGLLRSQLILSFIVLGEAKAKALLANLTAPQSQAEDQNDIANLLRAQMNYRSPFFKSGFSHNIRELHLDGCQLNQTSLPSICALLTGNGVLHTLNLANNELGGDCDSMAALAIALGSSAVDTFNLSSNKILPAPFIAFFNALPAMGCALRALQMSNVLQDGLDGEGGLSPLPVATTLEAARSIAAFLGDPQRCRDLIRLHLDANDLGFKGLRAIASSIVGNARAIAIRHELRPRQIYGDLPEIFIAAPRQPNRSIVLISLFHNIVDGPDREDDRRQWSEGTGVQHAVQAVLSRLNQLSVSQQENFYDYFRGRPWLRYPAEPEFEPLLANHAEASDEEAGKIKEIIEEVGGDMQQWAKDIQEAYEIGAGLDMFDFEVLLTRATRENILLRSMTKSAACKVLAAARIVGCRAKSAPPAVSKREDVKTLAKTDDAVHTNNAEGEPDCSDRESKPFSAFPGFLRLPVELRLPILRYLDEDSILSNQQFLNVVSFACEPSTINYGAPTQDLSRVIEAFRAEANGPLPSSSSLPAPAWSWKECFQKRASLRQVQPEHSREHAVPVDQYAEVQAFHEVTGTLHADVTTSFPSLPF